MKFWRESGAASTGTAVVLAASVALVSRFAPKGPFRERTGTYPEPEGVVVETDGALTTDESLADEGVLFVSADGRGRKTKIVVRKDETENGSVVYDARPGDEYVTIPLTLGEGTYDVGAYEQIEGNSYAKTGEVTFRAEGDFDLTRLAPNEYVDFDEDSPLALKARALAKGALSDGEAFRRIKEYVERTISYDYVKAATVGPGVLPDAEGCFESKRGICQDVAALVAACARSVGIPTEFVIGKADGAEHAWCVVETDGVETLYDPTAAIAGIEVERYEPERTY